MGFRWADILTAGAMSWTHEAVCPHCGVSGIAHTAGISTELVMCLTKAGTIAGKQYDHPPGLDDQQLLRL